MLKTKKTFLKTKHSWFHSATPGTLHSLHTRQPSQLAAGCPVTELALQDRVLVFLSLWSPDLHEGAEPSGGRVGIANSLNSLSIDPFENQENPVHQ